MPSASLGWLLRRRLAQRRADNCEVLDVTTGILLFRVADRNGGLSKGTVDMQLHTHAARALPLACWPLPARGPGDSRKDHFNPWKQLSP
jgi:hypothetical protein